jgi:hypothetical protein
MKKIISLVLFFIYSGLWAMSPNEMLVIIGAVKFYTENCNGLTPQGVNKMNQGLKRYQMNQTPIKILEKHPLAKSSYQTAQKFGCENTKLEVKKAGFGAYIY